MKPWIKICGLTAPDAVAAALACGVDAVGFVFHTASPRNLTPAAAAALARDVPATVARVAVTLHPSQDLIEAIIAGFAPDLLQTDVGDLAGLRLPAGLALLPVLRSGLPPPAQLTTDLKKVGDVLLGDWLKKAGPDGQAVVDAYRKL